MDESQQQKFLYAISISSASPSSIIPFINNTSRSEAFSTLEEFKIYHNRPDFISNVILPLIHAERHVLTINVNAINAINNTVNITNTNTNTNNNNHVVTGPTKLYALGILSNFVKLEYSKLEQASDRMAIRHAVLTAARQLVISNQNNNNNNNNTEEQHQYRFLALKIASLIADLVLRDFPQRWPTFIQDVFQPFTQGGLWHIDDLHSLTNSTINNNNTNNNTNSNAVNVNLNLGVKICLECLRLITEDCTDGDFNSKISTSRRNDVLTGLNETHHLFLPLIYDFLQSNYSHLLNAKSTLHQMQTFLLSNNVTYKSIHQFLNNQQLQMYQTQIYIRDASAKFVMDVLFTLEQFCLSMPIDWILPSTSTIITTTTITTTSTSEFNTPATNTPSTATNNTITTPNTCDFVTALLHLLREDTLQIHISAIACIQQLVYRKLEFNSWFALIASLPKAISEANDNLQMFDSVTTSFMGPDQSTGSTPDSISILVQRLPFHRSLSKLLATLLASHVANIYTDKSIFLSPSKNNNNKNSTNLDNITILSNYLNLLSDILSHPSAHILNEQLNMWITLLREDQIAKSSTTRVILQPHLEKLFRSIMTHLVKLRWEDVENHVHPYAPVLESSWDDKDEYDSWIIDFRSRCTQLIRLISATEPNLACFCLSNQMVQIFTTYCGYTSESGGNWNNNSSSSSASSQYRDYLDPNTGELTQVSTPILQLEGITQPLDCVLQGLPSWALDYSKTTMEPHRLEVRNSVRDSLSQLSNIIVSWAPTEVWLKFRRTTLLEALKYYWKYDPTTLIAGVDALLSYLGTTNPRDDQIQRDDIVGLRKRSGCALISVSKLIPHLLVSSLGLLSEKVRSLLSSDSSMSPINEMHLYEFLSCVATAVEDPIARSNFISDVLSNSLLTLEQPMMQQAISSADGLLSLMGVTHATANPNAMTQAENVKIVTTNFSKLFSAFNQLLSVGKRCHEAAKQRPNAGIPLDEHILMNESSQLSVGGDQEPYHNFPDEGAVRLADLSYNDPFIPLWPRILPSLIQILDSIFTIWHPHYQSKLMSNPIQCYIYAISDDEAYLAKTQGSKADGGVFGEGGTAGSIISGWNRRDVNLVPKWSGWFNEFRNTCFQLLGLLAAQRALYAPELANMYQNLVNVVASPIHLRSLEHRHMIQYVKQFIEYILLSCPSTLYQSHLSPILAPFFEHIEQRLNCTWAPIQGVGSLSIDVAKPLTTNDCKRAAELASQGGDNWYMMYYARGGLFVGDLDPLTSDAVHEKVRVELSRCFCDMLQSALALKGDWALVLANQARLEQALKSNDASKLLTAPSTKVGYNKSSGNCLVNADGSPRSTYHEAIEARKNLRIKSVCHYLLLEDERIAGYLVLTIIQCLAYPDAYTCRRSVKICHRILETTAWVDRYTQLLGYKMFRTAVFLAVKEPKWMVGIEWDIINLIRDLYCRLALGQSLLFGGQGPGMQQSRDMNTGLFEQAKTVDKPLQGGGVLCRASDFPRKVLLELPGMSEEMVIQMEQNLNCKLSAKDQKDTIRDFLRIAAEKLKETENNSSNLQFMSGLFSRATESESLLNQNSRIAKDAILPLPEKLVTQSMIAKKNQKDVNNDSVVAIGDLFKLS